MFTQEIIALWQNGIVALNVKKLFYFESISLSYRRTAYSGKSMKPSMLTSNSFSVSSTFFISSSSVYGTLGSFFVGPVSIGDFDYFTILNWMLYYSVNSALKLRLRQNTCDCSVWQCVLSDSVRGLNDLSSFSRCRRKFNVAYKAVTISIHVMQDVINVICQIIIGIYLSVGQFSIVS